MSRRHEESNAPLSVRVQDRLAEQELRELQAVESAANSRFVHAASNGIFVRIWSVAKELWLVLAFIWFLSDRWGSLEKRVADSVVQVASIQQSLAAIQTNLIDVKVEQTRVRTQLEIELGRDSGQRRTPVFGVQ